MSLILKLVFLVIERVSCLYLFLNMISSWETIKKKALIKNGKLKHSFVRNRDIETFTNKL